MEKRKRSPAPFQFLPTSWYNDLEKKAIKSGWIKE
jgi:hypothetical protein